MNKLSLFGSSEVSKVSGKLIALALTTSALSTAAFADYGLSADSFTNVGNNGIGYSLGWAFTASTGITVTSLGWYDDLGDGLVDSHEVGIYDTAGNLMVSGTVQSGTADPLTGLFRYTASLTGSGVLAAGQYVVTGVSGGNDFYGWDPVNAVWGSGITFDEDRYDVSSSLIMPVSTSGTLGWFGPNFEFTPVPEPATFFALSIGLVGFAVARRRK